MKKKKLLSITLIGITLAFFLTGCHTDKNTMKAPSASMKTFTLNGDYETFEFQAPEDWSFTTSDPCYANGYSSMYSHELDAADSLPYEIKIGSYTKVMKLTDEEKQMYQDLFAGNTKAYEDHIRKSFSKADKIKNFPTSSPSVSDYLNLLVPDESSQSSDADMPDMDFQYHHYNGTNGKITEVEYSFDYKGKTFHTVNCYREDISYLISGVLDDSVDLSSGKIALWIANTLKVTDHDLESKP